MYCYIAPLVSGKKVYLYRTLQSHIEKMLSNSYYLVHNSDSTIEVLKGNFHKDLGWDYNSIKNSSHIEEAHALLWVDRYLHISDSKDLLLINSSDFLDNKQKTAKQVCDFFEIEYIPVDGQFDAKLSGLNHNDTPITLLGRELLRYKHRKNKPTNTLFVLNVVNYIKKQYPDIPERMLFNL